MSKLQLSAAVRLGSLLIPSPRARDIDNCAITMALHAHGAVPDPLDAFCPYAGSDCSGAEEESEEGGGYVLPVRPGEAVSENWLQALRCHETLAQMYIWLDKLFPCPWCERQLQGTEVVYHPFDEHVMSGAASMDGFCSWIASIEPPEESYGVTLDIGLGVHFASQAEKNTVLAAAKRGSLSANAYIAAAVRFVMEHHLQMGGFECADPSIGPQQNVNYSPRHDR